ncbi:holin [Bacillus phage Silence]|nr:holin [Bacillus phage Silence]
MKKIDTGAWVRLILLVLTFVNGILAANGYDEIKLDETTLSIIIAGGVALWGLWKDNPFTKRARERKQLERTIKKYETK